MVYQETTSIGKISPNETKFSFINITSHNFYSFQGVVPRLLPLLVAEENIQNNAIKANRAVENTYLKNAYRLKYLEKRSQ